MTSFVIKRGNKSRIKEYIREDEAEIVKLRIRRRKKEMFIRKKHIQRD
jgi:hypothetical protein